MAVFDVFVSYAHADRERVLALRDALVAQGLAVWLDDREIETFESISAAIETGLARSKALVAFYSCAYPARRACQWELTAAFLAAQRNGGNPRRRVLVVNPKQGAEHVQPVQLRDALFATAPSVDDGDAHHELARRIAAHVERLDGELGELGVSSLPPWFGRRPVGAARFVGRVTDMWGVHSALSAGEVGLITGARGDPAVKVTGMGGIGKSLLAQEYALRFAAAYPGGVFWLTAHGHDDTGEALSAEAREAERDTQLLTFATGLGIETARLTAEQVPAALARGLDARGEPFLWLVDDLPGELDSADLERWLAPGRLGRTLLTTRSHDYDAIGAQIDLDVLSAQEGLELLAKHRPPDGPDEEQAARGLVEDLGRHALALDVAGAALRAEQGMRSYAAYRDALADPSVDELALAAGFAGELPGGHEASITTTLARSIKRLDNVGLDFLRLASRLAVDAIAADLVVEVFALADGLDEDAARRLAVAAMHDATSRSLAETTGGGARQVHTLISRTIRLRERTSSRLDELANAAVTALTRRLNAASAGRVSADSATLAHARHLTVSTDDERQATLLSNVALHDFYRGDFRSARTLHEQALAATRRLLGDQHPSTLAPMNNLAGTLRAQGDLQGARTLQQQCLATCRRILGNQHPDTLTTMNNLAGTLLAQGDLDDARTLHEQTLAARRHALGDEHPDTLQTMNDLAETLRAQGDLDDARTLHEQTLAASQRIRGNDHPSTLQSMNNLAATLHEQMDLDDARTLHEQALAAMRRVLGDEHPDTLLSMNNLAATLQAQMDLDGARTLHEQALAASRRLLGDEHPNTLQSMSNLAATLQAQMDLDGARTLHEQALAASRRLLGDEHPNTLQSMSNLAGTLEAQGDLDRARALHERALATSQRILGDEHPDTLITMSNLAATLRAQGDLDRARALHERALATSQRILGDEHPRTLIRMSNLAATLWVQSDLDGAHTLLEQLLAANRRVFGDEHPDTLASKLALANVLRRLSDARASADESSDA